MESSPSDDLAAENSQLRKQLKIAQKKLRTANNAFLSIVGKSLDGIVIVDKDKRIIYANYVAIGMFDRNIADLLGEPLGTILNTEHCISNKVMSFDTEVDRSDRSKFTLEVSVLPTEWNNEACSVVSFRDITERKKAEEMLDYMSKHDYLTDLPNRVCFEESLLSAIQEAQQHQQHMALLYLDLDNFKMVNDALGHDVGDLLLKQISNTLQDVTRTGDIVARLGGDEFAVILRQLRKPEDAGVIARKILNQLGRVFDIEGRELYTNASIGIAVYPESGINPVDLVKNADTAMYSAKEHGKNQYRYYTESFNKQSENNLLIINGLRSMLHNQEMFLMYQPMVDMNTSRSVGVEALLRWRHPKLGLVPPDKFLPFAEEAGTILHIGRWVIKQALSDYKRMHLPDDGFISLNLSANELNGAKTAGVIMECVRDLELKHEHVVLELTETSIMHQPKHTINQFNILAEKGVQIAVDDFGIGYSSLNYLKRLPINLLKIDKSFIRDLGRDQADEVIVQSIIQLAHGLGLRVVAEGVETKEQATYLKRYNCDYAQGYYYAKPMSFVQLKDYLGKQ